MNTIFFSYFVSILKLTNDGMSNFEIRCEGLKIINDGIIHFSTMLLIIVIIR